MAKIYVSQQSVRPLRIFLRILGWVLIAAGIFVLKFGTNDLLTIYLPTGDNPVQGIGMGVFLVVLDLILPDPYRKARRERRRAKRQGKTAQTGTATASRGTATVRTGAAATSGRTVITHQDPPVITAEKTQDPKKKDSRIEGINALLSAKKNTAPAGTPLKRENIQLGPMLDQYWHGCDYYDAANHRVMKYVAIPDGPQGFGPIQVPDEITTLEQLLPWLVANHDFHLKEK